jgi:anti-anti-sigma factor
VSSLVELSMSEDRGVFIARVGGEIDMSNTADLQIQIGGSVPNTALGLVIDLSATRYLDSSGIKLIFDLANRLKIRQQVLSLVVTETGIVHRVLEMVGGEEALNVHTSLESASKQIRGSAASGVENPLPEPG